MDAAQALAELTEISSQIEAAAIVDEKGNVTAATVADGSALAAAGEALLRRAEQMRGSVPAMIDVATARGNVLVMRNGGRTIVATTVPDPNVPVVLTDLERCLRDAA